MANVFGGNSSSGNCGPSGGGIIQSPRQQVVPSRVVESNPNVFRGGTQSPGSINLRDFYTKREVDKYLDTKADTSSVYQKNALYTKLEIDQLIDDLNLSAYASTTYVNSSVSSQFSQINTTLAENYYQKSVLYTKTDVDGLIAALSITGDYVSKSPTSLTDVTIDPDSNNLPVSLIVRSSNNSATTEVQRWENSATDYLGAIYADGKAKFVNKVFIGENVNTGEVALNVNKKRIGDVADPVNEFDAVNKLYMETFITETIDNVLQESDENYLVDALEY
jgi:hypothetical protein